MHAEDKSFYFMSKPAYFDIPFFQRAYVWDETNWSELLDNLMNKNHDHFLGSIILKKEVSYSGNSEHFSVIDGQQRLTTLSILLRACYDHIRNSAEKYGYDQEQVLECKVRMQALLFVAEGGISKKLYIKINHSHLDKKDYEDVINGGLDKNGRWEKYAETADYETLSSIYKSYIYFRKELMEATQEQIDYLWELLTTESVKFLVGIDLDTEDNEQTIFDTVNSAGVRLSSADTIKNLIFQKYVNLVRAEDVRTADDRAVNEYNDTWQDAFDQNEEQRTYWSTTRQYGRMKKSNLETFLHAFAVVKGFFNPAEDNLDKLPKKYREEFDPKSLDVMETFLSEIHDYAGIFKQYFFGKDEPLGFNDYIKRTFNICNALEVSTFYPYLLQQLYGHDKSGLISDSDLKKNFQSLERYVILNAICSGTTRNYNNECLQLVSGRKSPDDIASENIYITEDRFTEGLRHMPTNKLPTLLLFWIELYKRSTSYPDLKELKYDYTLEHIMPQKWERNWSGVPCYGRDNNPVEGQDAIESTRNHAIYEIGNMTLLNSRLNSSVSNGTFLDKCNGKNGKPGIKNLSDMMLTREVVDENEDWNELKIYSRTDKLEGIVRKIWNAETLPATVRVKKNSGKGRMESRLEFWAYALPIIRRANNYISYANVNPTTYNFVNGSFGIGGCNISCTAANDKAQIDLYLGHRDKERNKRAFDMLLSHRSEIEDRLGVALSWDRADDYKGSWISYTMNGVSVLNEDDWKQMADFLGKWSNRFRKVFAPYLAKEFPQNMWGSKSPQEINRRATIAAILRKWVTNTSDVIQTDKCSVPYTRFTTEAMSALIPDTPGHLSGWLTENHYFYEIVNTSDGKLYIQLAISNRNMTEKLEQALDDIDKYIKLHRPQNECDFWIAYRTNKLDIPDDLDERAIFNSLHDLLEEVHSFESDLRKSM